MFFFVNIPARIAFFSLALLAQKRHLLYNTVELYILESNFFLQRESKQERSRKGRSEWSPGDRRWMTPPSQLPSESFTLLLRAPADFRVGDRKRLSVRFEKFRQQLNYLRRLTRALNRFNFE